MISEFRHGLIILIALCPTLAPAQNQGQGPAPTDAHALTAFGGPPTTPTILYAPSDDDDSDLRDAISAACGGAVVDYFNTSNDTPTVATLQSYDLVLTCANFQYANAVTFGDRLAQYSDSGGRVVLGAFCTYTLGNSLAGKIMEPEYCPVTSTTGGNHFETSVWDGVGRTCVHDCVDTYEASFRDELVTQGLGQIDSTYEDGEIAVAYRTDRRVWYFNGYGLGSAAGDWPQMICRAVTCGDRRSMLVYDDTFSSTIARAAADEGFWVRPASSGSLFASLIESSEWDIVAVESSVDFLPAEIAPALEEHVADGGRAILSFWDLDGDADDPAIAASLRDTFGVTDTLSFTTPQFVFDWTDGHPIWNEPNSPISISVGSDMVNDNGDQLVPGPNAFAVGGFSSSEFPGAAAIVVDNECRTIVNGFLYDDMDPIDGLELAQNQVRYLMSRNGTLLLERNPIFGLARRAAERRGPTPAIADNIDTLLEELATCDFETVIVDAPTGLISFSAESETALGDFVESGGQVLFFHYDLDSNPGLQDTLGVAGTTDMFSPQPVFQWNFGHPIFTTPNSVPNPVGAGDDSFWSDNGDLMTVAPGATGLAGFVPGSSAGQAAIIVDNNNRTIVNSFDYDSMNTCAVVDLLENQLEFLAAPPTISPTFRRGDCNTDASFNITDPVFLLSGLVAMGTETTCRGACDANDDGGVDITDAVFMLNTLFVWMAPPMPAPFPECGTDPTPDLLGCDTYLLCL